MCDTCRKRQAQADSQAKWLRAFGLNPYAYGPFRDAYLNGLRCPEEGSVRGESGSAGDTEPG